MDRGSGAAPEWLAELESAPGREPDELARAVSHALTFGDVRLDRAAQRAVLEHGAPHRVLDALTVEEVGAVVARWTTRLRDHGPAPPLDLRQDGWHALDLVRRSAFLRKIPEGDRRGWADRILELVEASRLTLGPLFHQRVDTYGSKTLFDVPSPVSHRTLSWRQVAGRVEAYARGLIAIDPEGEPGPVGIVAENRPEMALVDLACLTSGIVDVMIPAASTEADVEFMLRQSRCRTAIASDGAQLRKVLAARPTCPDLRHVVVMSAGQEVPRGVRTLDEVAAAASDVPSELRTARMLAASLEAPATVMYTSGTTGQPKGIVFSQRNIVFKRFARALALPEIGDRDTFLCYLPLYHTFGRYLEMTGCVFWGATYCFLDSPSVEALVRGMRRHLPTVFISVPRKWIQLYEAIETRADPLRASDEEIAEAVRDVTGGRLRWGLSAAGYLPAEIFRFFQSQGVELLSGFGMTEATGGITMTAPGRYKDDSLGGPLPGIETRLAPDGELCIRGPYVMLGYLADGGGLERPFDADGWFATGDLMEADRDGDIRLVDRKKEIYKNVKGETIAPQRIENLFRDFDSVERVFLVGDHREFNTALIYPKFDAPNLDLRAMSDDERKTHFRSIVTTVNRFLAPYERIVDFAVIDRDLDPERGELTPKGTPKRSQVERNFAEVIRPLYRRARFVVGGAEVLVPNWLYQAVGVTSQDLQVELDRLVLPHTRHGLRIERVAPGRTIVGSCVYRHRPGLLNLGALLTAPPLWLGNADLVRWIGMDLVPRQRPARIADDLEWDGHVEGFATPPEMRPAVARDARRRRSATLAEVHTAACVLAGGDGEPGIAALRVLDRASGPGDEAVAEAARAVLVRAASSPVPAVVRGALHIVLRRERDTRFAGSVARFLEARMPLFDDRAFRSLSNVSLGPVKLQALVEAAEQWVARAAHEPEALPRAREMLSFLARYGAEHPAAILRLRAVLTRTALFAADAGLRRDVRAARDSMIAGFRRWLGPNAQVAVDPDTGDEYRWTDVIGFEDDVPAADRRRLLAAAAGTSLIREATFLLGGNTVLRLHDLPPRGVWLRRVSDHDGRVLYRATVQTRLHGAFEFAIHLHRSPDRGDLEAEIDWLILCGDRLRRPLSPAFGGYWERHDLWTEEFLPGENLEHVLRRIARRKDGAERLLRTWPFLAWTALAAYVDFWIRTGRGWEIAEPGPGGVIAPSEDYQSGASLASIAGRVPHDGLETMLRRFRERFLDAVEREHPEVAGVVDWQVVFSALLEVAGEAEGLALLRGMLEEPDSPEDRGLRAAARSWIDGVEERGFQPMRLYFAIERYRRWAALTPDATPQARAATVHDLHETYHLGELAEAYPETRVRFFRDTVFDGAPRELADGLDALFAQLRGRTLGRDVLVDAVAELRSRLPLDPDHDYFLARLSYPHLRPEDTVGFEHADFGGRHRSEMVVTLEDRDGRPFRMRHALNPREVGRLHRLFAEAQLDVKFRMEHRYLVAINDRGQVLGGLFYEIEGADTHSAHLEKIVVAEGYRRKGVADALMNEMFARLRAAGVKTVTTGFFRSEYFYGHGFRIEKRFAGLVKSLEPDNRS